MGPPAAGAPSDDVQVPGAWNRRCAAAPVLTEERRSFTSKVRFKCAHPEEQDVFVWGEWKDNRSDAELSAKGAFASWCAARASAAAGAPAVRPAANPGMAATPAGLRERWAELDGQRDVTHFYGKTTCLSNFYVGEAFDFDMPASFLAPGLGPVPRVVSCHCSEQAIVLCKAAAMGDREIFLRIARLPRGAETPGKAKALGRKVLDFDEDLWSRIVCSVAFEAVSQKFRKSPEDQKRLLFTGETLLAQAVKHEDLWGIGVDSGDPRVGRPSQWQGCNILGWALMEARAALQVERFQHHVRLLAFDAAQASGAASSSMPAMGYGLAVPSASYAAAQPRPNEPWLEVKQGELYCNLCGSWATDGHLSSDKHKRRAAEPEWYWTPPGGASFPDAASSLPAAMASLPALTQNPHGEAQRGRDGLPHGWTKHFPQALGSEGGVGAMSADIFCDVRLCEDLRLLDLAALQQSLEKDKDNLQLYVLKAKQEHEEKKETAAKREQREKEAARRDEVLEAWQELLGRIAAGDLEYAPAELRDIRIVVIKAVKANGRALQYASARLRGDREVVMQAVKQDGHAFPYASEDLRSDVEVVQEAFKEIPLEVTVIDLAGTTLFKLKLSPVLEMRLFSVRDLRKDIQKKLKQSHKEDEDVCQRLNEKWLNATEHQIKLVCGLDVLQDGDRALIHLLQGFPGLVVQMVFRSFDPEYEGDLLRASATGVQAEVDRLLHMAANPNCQDDSGRTALLLAADNGHASTVQCLYEAGADCDKATTLGETPLHMAAWGGHAAVVDYLCEEPKADSSLVMTDGKTALHMAAWSGPVETVKRLCDYHREREQQKDLEGSSGGGPTAQHFEEPDCAGDVSEFLERKTTSGETALHFACWNGHHEIVEYLHGQRANMQQKADDGKMPLHMAAWNGHAETTRLLVEWRADTCDKANDGNAPLHMACWNGHLDIVKILCKEFDSDDLHMKTKDGKTPLHMAAWTGHGRVLEFLLELGQGSGVTEQARQEMLHSKTVDGKTPLHMAGWNGHVDALRVLLEHRADQEIGTIDKKTALHMASWNGHSQAAQVLMHYRADTMAQTEEGLTPLHFAAWNNHLATVQLFLRSQVDKDFQAQDGKTPLHMAAWNGYVRVTRALLASHVDLRKLNEQNETALHMACWNGHLEVARLLIGECVRINWPECKDAQSLDGKTALHMAAWNGHTEVAQLLLREGAQHHLVTRSHNTTVGGQTAAHMAARNGHTQVLRALHEARADLALTAIDPTSPLELARANGHEEARNFLERPDGPRADGPRLAGQ